MNSTISISFCDFWPGFSSTNNYFTDSILHPWSISNEPSFLFYSCFGNNHKYFKSSTRIFYTGENVRPNYDECDYSFSFEISDCDGRNLRWPLYNLYYDPRQIMPSHDKDLFCCMVVSSPQNTLRLDFFHQLSRYKKVDSGGKLLNNVGGPITDKIVFIRKYKFCLAFENSYYPGYTTEKILQAKRSGCIPIYWGNPAIALDFDPRSFVYVNSFSSFAECINFIEYLDNTDSAYIQMRDAPILPNNEYTRFSDPQVFKAYLNKILIDDQFHRKRYFRGFLQSKYNFVYSKRIDKIGRSRLRKI